MEENIKELLEFYHKDESQHYEGIEKLSLTAGYVGALPPTIPHLRIYYRVMKIRDVEPKASLCIVHGFGEHSGKYINVAVHFALKNYEVHMVDLRSYGLSTGARTAHNLDEFQIDIHLLLSKARADIPCFLYGHSMGGLLVANFCINNPSLNLAGVIISSPAFEITKEQSRFQLFLLRFFNKFVPLASFIFPIPAALISRDDEFVKNLMKDGLSCSFVSSELGLSFYNYMLNIKNEFGRFVHPVLLMHGSADLLTPITGSVDFFEKCKSEDSTFNIVEGAYHELHHETNRKITLNNILDWTDRRIQDNNLGEIGNIVIAAPKKKSKLTPLKIGLFTTFSLLAVLNISEAISSYKTKLKILRKILNSSAALGLIKD